MSTATCPIKAIISGRDGICTRESCAWFHNGICDITCIAYQSCFIPEVAYFSDTSSGHSYTFDVSDTVTEWFANDVHARGTCHMDGIDGLGETSRVSDGFCSSCGAAMNATDLFCRCCGARVVGEDD